MIDKIEKKKQYIEWRLSLLEEMKDSLKKYKMLGGEDYLEHAKKCGKVSEHLKESIAKLCT